MTGTQQNHAYNTVCNGCRKIASFLWVYGTVHSLYRYLVLTAQISFPLKYPARLISAFYSILPWIN